MKIIFTIAFSALLLSACEGLFSTEVQLRVRNVSQYDFTEIRVNTGGGEHNFANLLSTETSQYKTFDFAYSYAFIELKIDGDVFTIQPIDFVGENKLDTGHYTYEVGADESDNQYSRLSLHLIAD